MKARHHDPVDDVSLDQPQLQLPALLTETSSGSKSPGRAQSFHGKPEHWRLEAPMQGILTRELGRGWA